MMATLDNNKRIIASNTFQGGLVTLLPPHLLADGATPDCSNVDFSRSYGRLTKRHGYSRYCDATGLNGATGLHEFIQADGTTQLYEAIDGFIYRVTAPSTYLPTYANGTSIKQVDQIDLGAPTHLITIAGHGYSTGNVVTFFGQSPDTYAVNGLSFTITVLTANTFTLNGTTGGGPTSKLFPEAGYVCLTSSISNLGDTNFTTFDNLCIAVSPTATTVKCSGAATVAGSRFSALLGTPPANAKYIEAHKDRVFIANHGAGHSRLSWCYLDNPEDWTTITGASTDAGYLDVGLDDGDVITGIKSIGAVMLIFKNTSTWALFGSDPTDFKVRKITPSIGCVAPRSIVGCDSFCIFLSNQGVYSANSEGVTMLSYNIKPTAEGWSNTIKSTACAGRYLSQYWLAINEDGAGGSCETAYVLDYVLGVWSRYTVPNPTVFVTRRTGALISGALTVGHINLHDDTENDNGSAIAWYWDTPDYDFGDWVMVKHPLDAVIAAKAISGKTITLSHKVDGASIGTTLSFSLTPSGSKDRAYFTKRSFPSTSYGRYLRFRLASTETSAAVEVHSFSIRAGIDERQQG